jgi:tRNA(Ile)-lysidine synthase
LPGGLGRLHLRPEPAGGLSIAKLAPTLAVRFRVGGERLRLAGEVHRRSLKKMLQAAGVPPWRRDRIPLIYSDDRLAAVGDLWVAEDFAARDGEGAVSIVWTREADRG